MQVFTYMTPFCENPTVSVFDPNRKRNARGEQRQQALLRAAAAVFGRLGYHQTTTNAIAVEAGGTSPEVLASTVVAEMTRFGKLIKDNGISVQ